MNVSLLGIGSRAMARSAKQSSTRWRLPMAASLVVAALLAPNFAVGEIIVDDFSLPAEVLETSTPSTFPATVTQHVGELDASREMGVIVSQTDPVWSFDANSASASVLSATLRGHSRTSTNSAIISFVNAYNFSPRDLTEDGANNALLFDFQSHTGTEPPTLFRVIASAPSSSGTSTDIYVAHASDFEFSHDPFTIDIPFSNFTFRDGAPGTPDFSRLTRLNVNFFFLRASEDIEWSIKLDRIRIGSVPIPEPSSVGLWVVGFLVLAGGLLDRSHRPRFKGGSCDVRNNCSRCHCRSGHVVSIATDLGN